jgi:replicative DNA helicase
VSDDEVAAAAAVAAADDDDDDDDDDYQIIRKIMRDICIRSLLLRSPPASTETVMRARTRRSWRQQQVSAAVVEVEAELLYLRSR